MNNLISPHTLFHIKRQTGNYPVDSESFWVVQNIKNILGRELVEPFQMAMLLDPNGSFFKTPRDVSTLMRTYDTKAPDEFLSYAGTFLEENRITGIQDWQLALVITVMNNQRVWGISVPTAGHLPRYTGLISNIRGSLLVTPNGGTPTAAFYLNAAYITPVALKGDAFVQHGLTIAEAEAIFSQVVGSPQEAASGRHTMPGFGSSSAPNLSMSENQRDFLSSGKLRFKPVGEIDEVLRRHRLPAKLRFKPAGEENFTIPTHRLPADFNS